jgi:hypothetical protein
MTWRVTLLDGEFCIVTDDGRNEVHVGTTEQARQWAEWYVSKRNMPSDTTDWPLPGLQVFDVSGGDAALYVVGGEPVGTIGWNGVEWWWYGLSWELQSEGEPVHIDVDPKQREAFVDERAGVAGAPEGGVRDARRAELDARIRRHRDETRDLAYMRAKLEAQKTARKRSL